MVYTSTLARKVNILFHTGRTGWWLWSWGITTNKTEVKLTHAWGHCNFSLEVTQGKVHHYCNNEQNSNTVDKTKKIIW